MPNDATPVFGMPLEQAMIHVWFDGFVSGASTGCNLFLPAEAADAKADDLLAAASASAGFRAQVLVEVRERMTELVKAAMANGPLPGISTKDVQKSTDRNGQR